MPFEVIERLCETYDKARTLLQKRMEDLETQVMQLKRARKTTLKDAADQLVKARAEVVAAIQAEPGLFGKPRTRIFAGTKVGLQKGKSTLSYDKKAVVELIEKKLPHLADTLIHTEKTPVHEAIKQLSSNDLKKIGASFVNGQDQVIVKAAASDIDKLIDAWIGDIESLDEEAA